MLFRRKDETQTVMTVAEEWTLLVAAVCLNANEQPSFFLSLPSLTCPTLNPPPRSLTPPTTTSSSSSCSESSLQFVPLPHTSLFKMTLLHFTANQLFCLTQSTGSASQPARINWGAAAAAATALCVRRERTSGGGDGEAARGSGREECKGVGLGGEKTNSALADISTGMVRAAGNRDGGFRA